MSARVSTVKVEKSLPGTRLDIFLRDQFPAVSRGAIQRLIEYGYVTVDGREVKATHTPRAGEVVRIEWPEPGPARVQPEPIPLEVLYEDEHLLVLNKPAGLVVHPAAGHERRTLVNALLHHCKGQLSGIGGVARPGIVHRLDKDTSGCMVVAKHDQAHLGLARQFAQREIEKVYLAIVCGEVAHDRGDIRAAIARHPNHRKRMAVAQEAGRHAWTSYRVRERLRGATLVEAHLHTGRTHQIRVHFQYLGYPLFGDELYAKRQSKRLTELTGVTAPRLMLHAWQLTFTHPITGDTHSYEAECPEDMLQVIQALRKAEPAAK